MRGRHAPPRPGDPPVLDWDTLGKIRHDPELNRLDACFDRRLADLLTPAELAIYQAHIDAAEKADRPVDRGGPMRPILVKISSDPVCVMLSAAMKAAAVRAAQEQDRTTDPRERWARVGARKGDRRGRRRS